MYGSTVSAAGAGMATLAMTGINGLWMAVAGVTLVTVGIVLIQIVPRQEH